jgi:hypothetical protein
VRSFRHTCQYNEGVPRAFAGKVESTLVIPITAYVEQILAPTLKKGDIVFMDNVGTHLVDGVEEAIEARGASIFYLPPYSP